MTIEECNACCNEFNTELEDCSVIYENGFLSECTCSGCLCKLINERESRETTKEDYGHAKRRGEL